MREGVCPSEFSDDEVCSILEDSYFRQVPEWSFDADGAPLCAAFEPAEPLVYRCPLTADLFEDSHP